MEPSKDEHKPMNEPSKDEDRERSWDNPDKRCDMYFKPTIHMIGPFRGVSQLFVHAQFNAQFTLSRLSEPKLLQ